MENRNFSSLLKEIHSKVKALKEVACKDEQGNSTISVEEIINTPKYDLQLCFLIFLAYTNSFDCDFPEDITDMDILLNKFYCNKKVISEDLWGYIKKEAHETFSQWMKLVKSYNLQNYRTPENDKILQKWANENHLFKYSAHHIFVDILIDVIDSTADTLGLALSNNRLLIIGDNAKIYKKIFSGHLHYSSYTLCPEDDYIYCCSLLNTLFFLGNDKYHILKRERNSREVFPFEEARFDTIYSFVEKKKDEDVLHFDEILSLTEIGGCGIVFGQSQNRLIEKSLFERNEFPLIADYASATNADRCNKMYVYKTGVNNTKVRAIKAFDEFENVSTQYSDWINKIVDSINGRTIYDNYQELTKEDFLFASAGNVDLRNVFRKRDQMDFVFRKIEDIIGIKTNNNVPFEDIPKELIVSCLSNNPFNVILSPKYLLNKDVYNANYSKEISEKAFIIEKYYKGNLYVKYLGPQLYDKRYSRIIEGISRGDNEFKREKTQMECRIMTSSGLLWNGANSFMKVNCSEEHPICYQYCTFGLDEMSLPLCQTYINEIEISDQFDEDFVIYQFTHHFSTNTGYILVAPTKEKQHEYYLKKKEEYWLKNADLINEVREEDRKAISRDLHYLKHDAAQYLSSINSTAHSFIKKLQQGPLTLNESMGADYTVKDALDNITKSVSHVTEYLKQMTLLTDVLPKRKVKISDLLKNFVNGCLKRDYYIVNLSIAENMENVFCLLDDRINKVFANILSNAERHAFTDFNRSDYELRINAYRENDMVIITFANNGTPPDPSLTEEGYFTRGLHVGKTGHDGIGGSIIRDTINAQDGIVHLHLNKDNKYPFIIEIKLKIEND